MNKHFENVLVEAQQAFIAGNYELAIRKCRLALNLGSDSILAYEIAGQACLLSDRYSDGEEYFRKAIEMDGDNGEHNFGLGNCLLAQNRVEEALSCYADAELKTCSNETRKKIYYTMGQINQNTGDLISALINYKKSESIPGPNSDRADILLNCVQIYVSQGEWQQAENCAMKLSLILPKEFKSYQLLFQIFLQQAKFDRAKATLEEAERYCPESSDKRIELSFNYVMLYCLMSEADPDHIVQHLDEAFKWLEQLDAMKDLTKANRIDVQMTRAEILLKLDRLDESLPLIESIASMDDMELTEYIEKARFILVECNKQLEEWDKMKTWAETLKTSLNPVYRHHSYYTELYACRQLAKKDEQLQSKVADLYDRAIAYYKQAGVTSSTDFVAYVYRAQTYADMGKFDRAKEMCELLPDDVRAQVEEYINSLLEAGNGGGESN